MSHCIIIPNTVRLVQKKDLAQSVFHSCLQFLLQIFFQPTKHSANFTRDAYENTCKFS